MNNDNEPDEKEAAPGALFRFEFGNLDTIMLLMVNGACNLIEKSWPVEKQAKRIAEFNALFMNMRNVHEEHHTTKHTKHDALCPFCVTLKLNTHLHREASAT